MSSGLVYGICAGPGDKADRLALPSIDRVDPGSTVLVRRDQSSIHAAYNSLVAEARSLRPAGLVLIHDDLVLRDERLVEKLTPLLADPSVGVVGVIGARGPASAEWWWYQTFGWIEETDLVVDCGRGTFDVDVVDGVFLALSPAALEAVRWLPSAYAPFHGYDLEACSQVRAAGMRVVVADLDVYHDSFPHGKISDLEGYLRSDRAWRRRWRRGIRASARYRWSVLRKWPRPARERLVRMLVP